ncbi:MAG: hypothetical protein MZU95_12375 [Desulfomicrobium escambiense]|nr:hypothetical protein [Desulfomicrobium escambiense]
MHAGTHCPNPARVLFLSVLDENGNVDDALMPSLTDDDVQRSMSSWSFPGPSTSAP